MTSKEVAAATGVAETCAETCKEVALTDGVVTTSTQAGKEVVVARSGGLPRTSAGKEVVSTCERSRCGQATHIVTGATYSNGTATY